jgi:hypothetical protein
MRWLQTCLASLVVACAAAAPSHEGAIAERPGYAAYREYCSACHGLDARGISGPASIDGQQAGDLTRLYERLGSPLPKAMLLSRIGRDHPFSSQWTDDLSICGSRLLPALDASPASRAARRGIALEILNFLGEIQVESGPAASSARTAPDDVAGLGRLAVDARR